MPRPAWILGGLGGLIGFSLAGLSMPAVGAQGQPPAATQGSGRGGQSITLSPSDAPAVGTGAISGIVRDGATGQPLQGALVQLASTGAGRITGPALPRQRTDAKGRFIFVKLPAGENYVLIATRQGYFDGGHRSRPGAIGGSRIDLRDGEWFARADIALWKPSAISGVVRDERGEPLVGVVVQPLIELMVGGRKQLASGAAATTDDRGAYRLANLRPGRYLIQVPNIQVTLPDGTAAVGAMSASARKSAPPLNLMRSTEAGNQAGLSLLVGHFPTPPAGGRGSVYPPTYHPSSRSIDLATPLTLGFGEHLTNVDVQLALVPSRNVSGKVMGPEGALAKVPVRLMPNGSDIGGEGAEAGLTLTDDAGEFTFLNVPAGEYAVIAGTTIGSYTTGTVRSMLPERAGFFASGLSSGVVPGSDNNMRFTIRTGGGPAAAGRSSVSVGDRDIADVVISAATGVNVSGHFLWDGGQTPPSDLRLAPSVNLEAANGDLTLGRPFGGIDRVSDPPQAPLPFTIRSVLPGRYLFGATILTTNYVVESVDYGGRNLLTTPLAIEGDKDVAGVVVRLTSKLMSISGFVRNTAATVVDSGAVLFFPADTTLWRDVGVTAPRFVTTAIASSGAYRMASLPPGDYFAVAIPDSERHRVLDFQFLQTLVPQAARISLSPGSQIKQDLRMAVIGR